MRCLTFIFGCLMTCAWSFSHASVETHFQALRNKPDALYAFLKQMPKGGELHYHYDGSVYAETMLSLARKTNLCIHPVSMNSQFCHQDAHAVTIKDVLRQPPLETKIVQAWSMQDFVPHGETAHDHFFAVFPKVATLYATLRKQFLAAILQKAAEQHEHYLEIIAFGFDGDTYAKLIRHETDFAKKRAILLANPAFQRDVARIVAESHSFLPDARAALHCDTLPTQPACHIQVNFQCYVRRVQSLDAVFTQALAGFMAAEQSKTLVGINLLDIEDNPIAQQDYAQHMQIYGMLHALYPKAHIALHAGELFPKTIASHHVISPIRDAILIGHAERIGHGLDIQEEPDPEGLAKLMAEKGIAVEINLTSNRLIFGVRGQQHPLQFYLKHHVPVVLSTDDEGILRTDLTNEYLAAAQEHGLDYASLRRINRNTLTYGFIPGKSIWANPRTAIPVLDCQSLSSTTCQKFIEKNPKAKLQWQLEHDLLRFEQQW